MDECDHFIPIPFSRVSWCVPPPQRQHPSPTPTQPGYCTMSWMSGLASTCWRKEQGRKESYKTEGERENYYTRDIIISVIWASLLRRSAVNWVVMAALSRVEVGVGGGGVVCVDQVPNDTDFKKYIQRKCDMADQDVSLLAGSEIMII